MGTVTNIMSILDELSLGKYYFEMGVLLRNTLLVNKILVNSEVWYGLTKKQIEELENIDKLLLRRITGAHSKTPVEYLYLEMGCVPLKYILKCRRIMYLHYLLNKDEDDMIFKFLMAQIKNPKKNDWYLDVENDMKDLKIDLSHQELKNISKQSLAKLLKEKAKNKAFFDLIEKKNSHTKLDDIVYEKLEMQPYLKSQLLYQEDAKILFRLRSNMFCSD